MKKEGEIGIGFFWNLIKPFKYRIFGFGFFALIWAIFPVIRSNALKDIIDQLTINGVAGIKEPVMIYLGSWIMIEICLWLRYFILMYLNPYLKKHIIVSLSNNMLHYNDLYYRKNTPAALVTSVKNVYDGIEDFLYRSEELLFHLILTFSILAAIYLVSPFFTAMISIWLLVWGVFIGYWGYKGYHYSLVIYKARLALSLHLGDIFANISTIKTFNALDYEKALTDKKAQAIAQADFDRRKFFFIVETIQSLFFGIVTAFSFNFLIKGFNEGTVTVGSFAMLLTLVQSLYVYLFDISADIADFSEVIGKIVQSTSQVHKIEHLEIRAESDKNINVKSADIIFENVKYKYPDSKKTEYDLDIDGKLEIKAGMTVALVGPSGGGKSTLFKLLLRLIDPISGNIYLDNQNTAKYSIDSVRKSFALVPQELGLFQRSVQENIAYGSFDKTEKAVIDVATQTKCDEFIKELDKKYDAVMGSDIGLSGGQKQRLVIARGLLRKAKIFLFDESTSALDAQTEQDVLSGIHELTQGCTKFIIAQRLNTIKHADLILVCDKGKIVEKGTHSHLLAKSGLYASLIDLI